MKYCIGCALLNYQGGQPGREYSEHTYDPSIDPSFACAKGHWAQQLDEDTGITDIEQAMQMAETCPDFVERT